MCGWLACLPRRQGLAPRLAWLGILVQCDKYHIARTMMVSIRSHEAKQRHGTYGSIAVSSLEVPLTWYKYVFQERR
jgi:hypothetical protein